MVTNVVGADRASLQLVFAFVVNRKFGDSGHQMLIWKSVDGVNASGRKVDFEKRSVSANFAVAFRGELLLAFCPVDFDGTLKRKFD